MNPGDYTVQPEEVEAPTIRKSTPNKTDLEAQSKVEKEIQKTFGLGFRDSK